MRGGFTVIDADRHVIEPIGLWRQYLPAAFRAHAPVYLPRRDGRYADGRPAAPDMCVDGEPIMALSDSAHQAVAQAALARVPTLMASQTPAGQLAAMDAAGIDIAVMFPTYCAYLANIDGMDPALAAAFARAYNDWLHDFCSADPVRLRGAGVLSRHAPERLLAEAERLARAGWRTLVLRPNPVAGRTLGAPEYAPLWALCAEAGISVVFHEGTHARVPTAGAARYASRFGQHACSHPMEQMMAFLSLLEAGVLERHPALKLAFLEAGCGWLPYWLWRLDEVEYRYLAAEVAGRVEQAPSAYFRRQCVASVEPGEPGLPLVLDTVGQHALVFGTDYPHLDHDDGAVDAALQAWRDLPRETVACLLHGNAARFYGIDLPVAPARRIV